MLNRSSNKMPCENYLFEDYLLKTCIEGNFQESLFQEGVFRRRGYVLYPVTGENGRVREPIPDSFNVE
jgi:hypothetical protein